MRVEIHEGNVDRPENHSGRGVIVDTKPALMGRLQPLHYVLFDGLTEDVAAWFYDDEFDVLSECAGEGESK